MFHLLDFPETEKLLQKYKIPFVKAKLVKRKKEADKFLEEFGYPLVLKIYSPGILHKSDLGGVKVNITNKKKFDQAWRELSDLSRKEKGLIQGFLIYRMLFGKEVVLGMKRDNSFGPVIMAGLGGIFVEIIKDISFGVCPLSRKEALEVLKRLKIYPILLGRRGEKGVNIKALLDVMRKLCSLSLKEDYIKYIDFNPLILNSEKTVVVDPKFIIV